ncbi:MAG TPA: BsuPI-related putative proteinase inhibitor [Gemmatimonadales bacterium]|nr:BsuPI-related putative proteinase inhibitor [Gemmatimonadales bacterium]
MLYAVLLTAALVADSMTVELSVPDHVPPGAPVPLALRVTNRTTSPLTLYLRGRPIAFDVIVTDSRGKVVWRRLEGATTSMALQVRELKPGETLALDDVWQQRTNAGTPVKPGKYHLKGQLLTDSKPLETASVSLQISR